MAFPQSPKETAYRYTRQHIQSPARNHLISPTAEKEKVKCTKQLNDIYQLEMIVSEKRSLIAIWLLSLLSRLHYPLGTAGSTPKDKAASTSFTQFLTI
jgi:hypothetical protein